MPDITPEYLAERRKELESIIASKFRKTWLPASAREELSYIDAIEALQRPVAWQPIEGAPLNDRFLGGWQFQGEWKMCVCYLDSNGLIRCWPGAHRYNPTHFQPLPTPPHEGQ